MTSKDVERKRQVARVFDRAASSYDRVAGSYFSRFGPRLLDRTDIRPGATVIDVACGKGATLLPAASRCGSDGSVIGVDLSMEMVREARARTSDEEVGNTFVAVMDGEALALRDSCADVVVSGFSMHFFPDPLRAVGEFARVLKPGGSVLVSEWGATDERWAWEDDLIAGLGVAGVSSGSFDTPAALEGILLGAGLRDVDVTNEAVTISLVDEEEWWAWKWSYSFRHVLERLEPQALERFKTEAFEHLRSMRTDSGIPLTLHALMAVAHK